MHYAKLGVGRQNLKIGFLKTVMYHDTFFSYCLHLIISFFFNLFMAIVLIKMFLSNTYVFLKEDDLRLIHIKTTTVTADPKTAPPNAAPMIASAGVALMHILFLFKKSI